MTYTVEFCGHKYQAKSKSLKEDQVFGELFYHILLALDPEMKVYKEEKVKYIVIIKYSDSPAEYYGGKKYKFKGARYPVLARFDQAKRYKTHDLAKKAGESILGCEGGVVGYEIKEVREDE